MDDMFGTFKKLIRMDKSLSPAEREQERRKIMRDYAEWQRLRDERIKQANA